MHPEPETGSGDYGIKWLPHEVRVDQDHEFTIHGIKWLPHEVRVDQDHEFTIHGIKWLPCEARVDQDHGIKTENMYIFDWNIMKIFALFLKQSNI